MYKWVFSERLKMSCDEHRCIASGRVFQARGPATAKAQSPSVECHVAGMVKSAKEAERRPSSSVLMVVAGGMICSIINND